MPTTSASSPAALSGFEGEAVLSIVFLLQAAASAPPERIDLTHDLPAPCPAASGYDIVVCARDRDADRLLPLPPRPIEGLPDGPLSFRLPGGGTGKVEAMQTYLPGATGQGARVTLRIPLGKHAKPAAEK